MKAPAPINATSWEAVEALFATVFDAPADERRARLEACPWPEVRAAVERLLAQHAAIESGDSADPLAALDAEHAGALLREGNPEGSALVETFPAHRVIRLLGRGSMGAVYLAEDTRLGRLVALKRLSVHLAADQNAMQRFREEARMASSVDHPHVAPVFEIGETGDGGLYLSMAYCPGGSLRERLHGTPHAIDDVLRIGRALAAGLVAVHARGIVHRDLKPENILLNEQGDPRIADFGIAKFMGRQLTGTGVVMGTVAYMSPEQTRGSQIDQRTDIWSLGVVLYELLTGRRPFVAEGSDALVYAIRHDSPPAVRTLRPDVPRWLDQVVSSCLEKDPARRPRDARLLRELLTLEGARSKPWWRARSAITAPAVVVALASAAYAVRPRSTPATSAPITVAVRPIIKPGPLDTGVSISMLLSEEFGRRLAMDPALRVSAREAVGAVRGGNSATLSARLGAAAVIESAMLLARDSMHMTVRLVRRDDGRTTWSHAASRPREAWRALALEVAQRTMMALHREFGGDAAPGMRLAAVAAQAPIATHAFEAFMRGRMILQRRDRARMAEAAEYFREAIALDSGFTRAYLGLADVYNFAGDASPRQRAFLAQSVLERALRYDTTNSTARRLVGWHAMFHQHDWRGANRHLQAAVVLDPTDIWAHHAYAGYLAAIGLTDSSLAVTQRVAALDPVTAITASHLGLHLIWRERYPEAIEVLERALASDSSWRRTRPTLARAYTAVGRYDDAIRLLRHKGDDALVFDPSALIVYAHARAGRIDSARAELARLTARARHSYVSAASFVVAYLGLRDTSRALDWMERIPDDSGALIFPLAEPLFDPIREAPRYRAVLSRMGLQPYEAQARATRARIRRSVATGAGVSSGGVSP